MNYNVPYVKDIETCPGFGFFPSDECLVNIYLARKNSGQAKETGPILEIDLYAYEPGELLGLPTAGCDNCKYFFNKRRYANERNKLYQRRTKTGYWKSTGNPRKIKGGSTKRSLIFYEKDTIRGSKAVRTKWIIQEYDNGGEYIISKLQIKNDKIKESKPRRRQNVWRDDFTEYNQTVYRSSEVQNVSTDGFTADSQTVYCNSEVQNVSTDVSMEDNQIDFHDDEDLSGFEYQNQKEMMIKSSNVIWSLQNDLAAINLDQTD